MKYCTKCGNCLNDDVKFCNKCGNPVGQTTLQTADDFVSKVSSLNDTPDTTAEFDPKDIEENKVLSIFAYLSWLVIIPILAAPNSKFARYHANQGLILAIIETVWGIAQGILTAVLFSISWRLVFISGIFSIVNLVFLAWLIIGIYNVANGRAKELPFIGKFRILK